MRPTGAVQTFKETHTIAPSKSTPARNSCESRRLRESFVNFKGSLMAGTQVYQRRVLVAVEVEAVLVAAATVRAVALGALGQAAGFLGASSRLRSPPLLHVQ